MAALKRESSTTLVIDDDAALRAQGHVPELPRQFSMFSALSLAFVITNSWIGCAASFATAVLAGGGPGLFWGTLIAAVACACITIGLAELASAFPTSGGQYHFTFMVAPPKYRAVAAFITGWLSTIAWCLTAVSAGVFDAQLLAALISFNIESFEPTRWQIYLIFIAMSLSATAIVCLLPRLLPKLEEMFFWSSLLGFLVTVIVVGAMSHQKQPAEVIFTEYTNYTGWPDGFSFLIGLGSCMYTFLATDAATHISEEVPRPGYNIPRVMFLTPLIGLLTTLVFILVCMFCSTDLEEVANSSLPALTLFYQGTGSKTATSFLIAWLLFNYFGATIGCTTTAGRLAWAFSRDNGLPLSKTFAKVHDKLRTPINVTLACFVFEAVYGLIYIGSTTAFSSILSLSILGLNVTYVIPQGIAVIRGRSDVLPERYFHLGTRFGALVNALSCIWVLFFAVIFCFPVFAEVTVQNMNYLSPVAVGICVLILITWYAGKRKTFTGPAVSIVQIDGVDLGSDLQPQISKGQLV